MRYIPKLIQIATNLYRFIMAISYHLFNWKYVVIFKKNNL
jgi:hypothetical protein